MKHWRLGLALSGLLWGAASPAAAAARQTQLELPAAALGPSASVARRQLRAIGASPPLPTLLRQPGGSLSFLGSYPLAGAAATGRRALSAQAPAVQLAALLRRLTGLSDLELHPLAGEPAEFLGPTRTARFTQTLEGIPIEGAYALVQTAGPSLRYLRHHLVVPPRGLSLTPRLDAAAAQAAAGRLFAPDQRAQLGPAALRLLYREGAYHLTWRVEVRQQRPQQTTAVYIDAATAALRTQVRTSFDEVFGQLMMNVEPLCQGDRPQRRAVPHTQWSMLAGQRLYTDSSGRFAALMAHPWSRIELQSPYVRMTNFSGELAGPWRLPLQAAFGALTNPVRVDDAPLDQSTPYFHVLTVRQWLMDTLDYVNYQLLWAMRPLELNINTLEACNASYDGSLNFAADGDGCMNTGRTAAIVFHEYAHGIHDNSAPPGAGLLMDDQVGEGIADYVAATLTNNPVMSGIHSCDDAFRSCINRLTFCGGAPCDITLRSEAHDAGQVMCAVWWDFREQLRARYGSDAGRRRADQVFLHFLSLVGDFDSAYEAAIAADEDDDSDPSNGTVHSCELNQAFASEVPGAFVRFPELLGRVPCAAP
jgi:hypothetical protein